MLLTFGERVGDPLAGWSAQVRTKLPERLSARLGERAAADPDRVFDDVRGLLSGIEECLGWVRDAERWVSAGSVAELGKCKAALYRLRVFAEVLEGHADRYWVNGAQLEPLVELGELDAWIDRVARRRERLQHHLPSPIQPLLSEVLDGLETGDGLSGQRFQRGLAEFAAELLSIVESSGADAVVDSGIADADAGHVDAVAEASAVQWRIAVRVAEFVPERSHWDEPEQIGYGLLEEAGDQRPTVLRQLVVLTAPLDVGRAPGSHIEFLRVDSAAETPLPFDLLGSSRSALRSEDKVRGSDIGSFAAFLSAKWRANDWMWGRLDAATSLVALLLDPARLVQYNDDPEGLGDALQALVSRPTQAELGELAEDDAKRWRDFLAGRWAAHAGDVRAELDALFQRPDDEHPLIETRRVLTERLHWTIAAREIPVVSAVAMGAAPQTREEVPASDPHALQSDVRKYSVGQQRVADLGEQRTASIATRLALIGYRAARPGRGSVLKLLARVGMTILKPLLLAVAFTCAAPTRAAVVAFAAATAVAFTGSGVVPAYRYAAYTYPDQGTGWWQVADLSGSGVQSVFAAVLAVVFAAWLGWQLAGRLSRGRGLARWLAALFATAVLLAAGYGLLGIGFRLGPLGLALVAVALTWLATFAYRTAGRVAATVVTAAAFALVISLSTSPGWIPSAVLVSAYAHMLLTSSVDVLRPRPRPA